MKKTLLCLICALLPALAVPGAAKRRAQKGNEARPEIPILAWYSIPAGQFATQERYEELRDAGFTLSFSHIYKYEDAIRALDLCAATGLKSIFMCPELEKEPEATVAKVKDHPGLGGYFLRDEPGNDAMDALGEWARRIQSVDSLHPCYLNLLPEWAFSREGYIEHLRLFCEKVPLPQISYDLYPILSDEKGNITLNHTFYDNLELVSKAARDEGKPFWAFALSTAHTPYPIPTIAHLRLQLYAALCYGAQCLQYFTYWNPGTETWNFHEAPIKQDGQRSPVYELVREMNREIQARAFVFLGSRVESVCHMGKTIPQGTRRRSTTPPHFRQLDSGDGGALVATLRNGEKTYVVVQNTSPTDPVQLQIETDETVTMIRPDGSVVPAHRYGPLFILEAGNILVFSY
ncbi:MAG: hypothetical protein IJ253_05920 [Bacteroidaceae bacterium]|nr:hypothetical protein [Bacteroidaceae bacterium]